MGVGVATTVGVGVGEGSVLLQQLVLEKESEIALVRMIELLQQSELEQG